MALPNDAFKKKLGEIAGRLGTSSDALSAIFKNESGGDPSVVNKLSGATGLIQFMPKTAIGLGTTVDKLKRMNRVDQLDYVEKYLKQYAKKGLSDPVDAYRAVFFPQAIGKGDDYVLETKGMSAGLIAKQNSGIDLNKDGKITNKEIADFHYGRNPGLRKVPLAQPIVPAVADKTKLVTQLTGIETQSDIQKNTLSKLNTVPKKPDADPTKVVLATDGADGVSTDGLIALYKDPSLAKNSEFIRTTFNIK